MGRMGRAVACRLLTQNFEVAVWNRTAGKADEVVAAGGYEAADAAQAVRRADVVITTLADDAAVREVVWGASAVASHLAGRLLIDASTSSPALSAEAAERIERFLAMPIAGAPAAVREGHAVCLVGGPQALISEAVSVMSAMSRAQHRYPSASLASTAKVVANLVLLVNIAGLAECLAIGRAGGLSDDELAELFADSPMLGPGVKNRLGALIARDGPTWWTMRLGAKDAALAVDVSKAAEKKFPVTLTVRERYQSAVELGLADADIALLSRLYESDPAAHRVSFGWSDG
jgi:3-hydroxyisobutyrate dehydrogenase-like beta-hydroxyacid dehydrogenase